MDNIFVLIYVLLVCFGAAVLICWLFSTNMPGWFSSDRYDVTLQSFSAAEDGKTLTVQVARKWEKGIISDVFTDSEGCDLFVDFDTEAGTEIISSQHLLEVSPECNSVYFNRSEEKYMLVLRKDEAGRWSDVSRLYIFKERESDEYDESEYDEEL